jgi:hypothetical protein
VNWPASLPCAIKEVLRRFEHFFLNITNFIHNPLLVCFLTMIRRNLSLPIISVFILLLLEASTIDARGLKGATETGEAELTTHRELFFNTVVPPILAVLNPVIDVLKAVVTIGGLITQLLTLFGLSSR